MSRRFIAYGLLGMLNMVLLSDQSSAEGGGVDQNQWPFSAIGKLNVVTGPDSRGHCTATLVGRKYVLTAAHCLYDPRRKTWVAPASVHFLPGYREGDYKAHSTAKSYHKPDEYEVDGSNLHHDWALIELENEVSIKPLKIAASLDVPDDKIFQSQIVRAGYRQRANQLLTMQDKCATAAHATLPLILQDCQTEPGELGTALLDVSGSEPQIIGILVAQSASGAMAVSVNSFGPSAAKILGQ